MLAQTAYAATAPVRTSRGTEYAAFQKVTARMVRATRRDGADVGTRRRTARKPPSLDWYWPPTSPMRPTRFPIPCARGCVSWPNSRFSTAVAR
jgi:hypothetical protein